jgi:hypothetical protein
MTVISSPAPRPSNNPLITSVQEHLRLIAQEVSAVAFPFLEFARQVAEYAHDRSLTDWHTALSLLNALPSQIPPLILTVRQIHEGVCDLPGSYWLIPGGTLTELEILVSGYVKKILSTSGNSNSLKFQYVSPQARAELGNTRVNEDQWIWMSHEILERSYDCNTSEQIGMMKELDEAFEMPSLRQAVAVAFFHNVATGESIFQQRKIGKEMFDTYIRVKEKTQQCHLIIGGSVPSGVNVRIFMTANNALGAMAFRTF